MKTEHKRKILFVNNNMAIGGVQRALVNLLREIHERYDITLFLFYDEGDYRGDIPSDVKVLGAKSPLSLLGMSQVEAKQKGLSAYLSRGAMAAYTKVGNNHLPVGFSVGMHAPLDGFDVAISYLHSVEGHMLYGGCNEFVLRKAKADVKIAYLHCDFLECGSNTAYVRGLLRQFDRVATVSEGCRSQLLKAMPELEEKTFCAYNCHPFEEIRQKSKEEPVRYDKNAFHMVTVARLDEGKGILRVLPILRELGAQHQIQWHIVGDGRLMDQVANQIRALGLEKTVFLYGNQKNPYRFLKNAQLFLLPSYHEAAPMVFMEAKALGLPVLTTNTISAGEFIREGYEGFVCANTEEGIREGLLNLLEHPQALIQCRAYLARQEYTNERGVQQFDALIREDRFRKKG